MAQPTERRERPYTPSLLPPSRVNAGRTLGNWASSHQGVRRRLVEKSGKTSRRADDGPRTVAMSSVIGARSAGGWATGHPPGPDRGAARAHYSRPSCPARGGRSGSWGPGLSQVQMNALRTNRPGSPGRLTARCSTRPAPPHLQSTTRSASRPALSSTVVSPVMALQLDPGDHGAARGPNAAPFRSWVSSCRGATTAGGGGTVRRRTGCSPSPGGSARAGPGRARTGTGGRDRAARHAPRRSGARTGRVARRPPRAAARTVMHASLTSCCGRADQPGRNRP